MRNASLASLTALVMTLALGTFGCASSGETAPSQDEMATATESAAEEAQPMNSGEILKVLQTINQGEIEQAQLAMQRSDSAEVHDTAKMIIQDHRAMNERIDQIAQETNSELSESALSRGIETQAAQIQSQLAELSGAEFDREFLRRQIQLHELSLDTARQDLMPSAEDPQVRQLLTQAADHLEQHLTVAEQNFEELQDSAIGGGPDEQSPDQQSPDEVSPEETGPQEDPEGIEPSDRRPGETGPSPLGPTR